MTISVEVPQIFRKHTNGSKVLTVEAATIREVFQRLDQDYPGLRKQLLTDDGELHRFINVYLNEEDIRYIQRLETPLQDGDRVSILPAVAGGRPAGGLPAVAEERPAGGLPAVTGGRPAGVLPAVTEGRPASGLPAVAGGKAGARRGHEETGLR